MELAAKYNAAEVEDKWYAYWLDHKFFHSEPDEKEPYTIVIPPPNVTGILHMGHVLNNTLNDAELSMGWYSFLGTCPPLDWGKNKAHLLKMLK